MGKNGHIQASDKEKFDLLYASLQKYHLGFIDSSFKVVGFLLLVMGWLLTSTAARTSLQENVYLSALAIAGLLVSGFVFTMSSMHVRKLSKQMFEELNMLKYMPENHYSDRFIRKRTLIIFTASIWGLVLVACALILFIHCMH